MIHEYDKLGGIFCIPLDLAKYDPIAITRANMNGFHSKKKIEINLVRIGKIKLEFTAMKYVDKVIEKLEEMKGIKENLPVLQYQSIRDMDYLATAWIKKGDQYYHVLIHKFESLGGIYCTPLDLINYDPVVITQANMNGFHSRKKKIEINLIRIGTISLEFTAMKYVKRVIKKLNEMKGLNSDEEPGK